jgi:GAF domain-containing protein
MDDVTTRLRVAATTLEDFQSPPDGRLDRLLDRLAETATRVAPAASAASVTVLQAEGLTAWTATATDETVAAIDLDQYTAGDGPCLTAARGRHPVRAGLEEARRRWPTFAESADRSGMRSYLSAPLMLGDGPLLGSLNLYGRAPDAFGPLDEALVTLLAAAASATIVQARRYLHTQERVEEITVALTSRAEIDQAKGVLMARHGITADKAFEMLVIRSQRTNTKLRDIARDLLKSLPGRAWPLSPSAAKRAFWTE